MSFVICKRIINGKYFHSVRLNCRACFEFHTAQPARARRVLLDKTIKSSSLNVRSDARLPKETGPSDFFGIESDDGVIHVDNKASCAEKPSDEISSSSSEERILRTSFGHLRFDSDNEPISHGQFEESMADTTYSYGRNSHIEKIQNFGTSRKRGGINKLERFYAVTGSETQVRESSADLWETELPVSETVLRNDGVFAKLEASDTDSRGRTSTEPGEVLQEYDNLGFIDSKYFGDDIHDAVGSGGTSRIADADRGENFCFEHDLAAQGACGDKMRKDEVKEGRSSPLKLDINQIMSQKELGYVDSIYFGDSCDNSPPSSSGTEPKEEKLNHTNDRADFLQDLNVQGDVSVDSSFIDSLYFGTRVIEDSSAFRLENSPVASQTKNARKDVRSIYEISGHGIDLADSASEDAVQDKGNDNRFVESTLKVEGTPLKQSHILNIPKFEMDSSRDSWKGTDKVGLKRLISTAERKIESLEAALTDAVDTQLSNETEQKTAYNYVLKLRRAEEQEARTRAAGEVDSKGHKTLNQIPDLSRLTRSELLDLLKDQVLFSSDDIVILNKPYNLVVHESKTTKLPSLSSVLDDLARRLDTSSAQPQLYTVHRLDKETTGCLLLARNELAAQRLKSLFLKREIEKQYLVVTARVPYPQEGVIEMPIAEGKIGDKVRMVLQPDIPSEMKYKPRVKNGKKAVTYYRVISTSENAALVEVKPETGIKHQIRVHLGFGLNCPVLGDHKYSHLTKLAPQRLTGDILRKLNIRQSKVRNIPMYIHAESVRIPKFLGERDLYISAPLPKHFSDCIKRLKFRKN